MALRKLLTFHLPADFHADCGWLGAVRSRSLDPAAADFLRERHPAQVIGRDPAALIADWHPAGARMLYYVRQKSDTPCQFVATDGVFVHTIDAAGPDWRTFNGPVDALLHYCCRLWLAGPEVGPFPLAPRLGGYPGGIVIHELLDDRATLATSEETRRTTAFHPEETPCLTTAS